MKKKNNLCRKIGNKKLTLNKERISQLSMESMKVIKGGESQINDYCHAYTYYTTCVDCLIINLTVGVFCVSIPPETDGMICR